MANVVTIEAEVRARSGKGAARATRRAGKVPAVIYGGKQEPNLIALDPRVVIRELHRAGWQSRLYEITAGAEPIRALIRGARGFLPCRSNNANLLIRSCRPRILHRHFVEQPC